MRLQARCNICTLQLATTLTPTLHLWPAHLIKGSRQDEALDAMCHLWLDVVNLPNKSAQIHMCTRQGQHQGRNGTPRQQFCRQCNVLLGAPQAYLGFKMWAACAGPPWSGCGLPCPGYGQTGHVTGSEPPVPYTRGSEPMSLLTPSSPLVLPREQGCYSLYSKWSEANQPP